MLSFFLEEDANYISRRVVMDILQTPIMEESSAHRAFGNKIQTKGHVRLVWSMYKSKKTFESIFRVSEEFDPWYDILLGNDTMSIEGIHCPFLQCLSKPAAKSAKNGRMSEESQSREMQEGGEIRRLNDVILYLAASMFERTKSSNEFQSCYRNVRVWPRSVSLCTVQLDW
jgi:hypothetical protein